MKKLLFTAFMMVSISSFAQNEQKIDKVSRATFSLAKKQFPNIENQEQKDIIIKYYEDLKSKTEDEELKNSIDQEIISIKETPFSNRICFISKNINDLNLDKKTLKKYTIKNDKFKERTFISPSNTAGSLVYPYLSIDDNTNMACLRMVTTYRSSNWLFTEKMFFILDDEKFEYDFINPKRDVESSSFVTETSDIAVDEYLHNFLLKYKDIKTKESIRYKGDKGVRDINDALPKTKERISDILNLVELIKK